VCGIHIWLWEIGRGTGRDSLKPIATELANHNLMWNLRLSRILLTWRLLSAGTWRHEVWMGVTERFGWIYCLHILGRSGRRQQVPPKRLRRSTRLHYVTHSNYNLVFWDVKLCSLVDNQRFGRPLNIRLRSIGGGSRFLRNVGTDPLGYMASHFRTQ
jgi:hypothetical protein